MSTPLILLFVMFTHAQIQVRLDLLDAPSMSKENLASALYKADLSLAGEQLATLTKYDDQVVGIRSIPGECAAGYFLEGDKCTICPCTIQLSSVKQIYFRPLES
jgi:hypothetical protein